MRDQIVKIVYNAMQWAVENAPAKRKAPDWVEGGNSFGQDLAREKADASIAALPGMVKDLEWMDFASGGSKALVWGKASYMVTKWNDGKYQLNESYPGIVGNLIADGYYPSIDEAKAAANAHHRAAIMAAFGVTL